MAEFLTTFAVLSVAATSVGVGVLAVVVARLLVARKTLSSVDWWTVVWLVYNGITHLGLEAFFVYMSLTGTVNSAEGLMAEIWQEYAKADYRWGVSDPTVVAVELWNVPVNGLLCLVLLYAILQNQPYRHFVQIVLCVSEIMGGWITFAPEWLSGSVNLNTSNWLYMWVYLFFFNMIWVVVPAAMLCHSYYHTTTATKHKQH